MSMYELSIKGTKTQTHHCATQQHATQLAALLPLLILTILVGVQFTVNAQRLFHAPNGRLKSRMVGLHSLYIRYTRQSLIVRTSTQHALILRYSAR